MASEVDRPVAARAPGLRRSLPWVLGAGAAAVVLGTVLSLVSHLRHDEVVYRYQAPLYWLDYGDGFVRRGLPGEALSWFGDPPSSGAATGLALGLSLAGIAAVGGLAARLARAAPTRLSTAAVVVVVVLSPFGVPLLARDLGRYDTVGLVAVVLLALLPGSRPLAAVVCGSAALVVAVACEEFLVAYALPVALVLARQLGRGDRRRAARCATGLLLPGATLAAVSVAVRPDRGSLAAVVRDAEDAGVPAAEGNDAVTFLGATVREQLATVEPYGLWRAGGTAVLFALLFAACAWTLWALLGRPDRRTAGAAAALLAGVATALGVVGVDYRRWWGLAFLAFVAVLARLSRRDTRDRTADRPQDPLGSAAVAAVTAVVVVASVVLQNAPIGPMYLGALLP